MTNELNLPTLKGTAKQIAWAEKIRENKLERAMKQLYCRYQRVLELIYNNQHINDSWHNLPLELQDALLTKNEDKALMLMLNMAAPEFMAKTTATYWIDRR